MNTVGRFFGVSVVSAIVAAGSSLAQVELAQSTKKEEQNPYFIDAMSFAVRDSRQSRLDVFVQIGYDKLSFVKRDDLYYASYEMTITVLDSQSRLVNEKLWTEEIKGVTFDQSVSQQLYSLVQRVFEVPPGRYYIATILRDNETKNAKRLTKQIDVPDYSTRDFSLSDIMLVRRLTIVGEKRTMIPSVSPNVGSLGEPFHIFLEAYNIQKDQDTVKFVVTVFDEAKNKKLQFDTLQTIDPVRSQVFLRIDHLTFPVGDYTIFVQAFPADYSGVGDEASLATTSRKFDVRWTGVPAGIKDLDLAISQIQYIAEPKDMDHINAATTPEEKQKRFLEFWKKKDPNPNTPRNEKMEEYYQRVEFANQNFKHYIDGWRTDMGMVFIIFGSPSNVDRHPFDIDSKPYEVWSYYELNHQFVFVDESGFGDYRLITPIWEVWRRPRN